MCAGKGLDEKLLSVLSFKYIKFCSAYEVGKLCEYVGSLAGECLIALELDY
jgi:hypothetical protein